MLPDYAKIYVCSIPAEEVREKSICALREAIKICGSLSELSRRLGGTRQMIYRFLNVSKRGVSAPYVIAIEKATGGLVKRHQIRCDLYPYHR